MYSITDYINLIYIHIFTNIYHRNILILNISLAIGNLHMLTIIQYVFNNYEILNFPEVNHSK